MSEELNVAVEQRLDFKTFNGVGLIIGDFVPQSRLHVEPKL